MAIDILDLEAFEPIDYETREQAIDALITISRERGAWRGGELVEMLTDKEMEFDVEELAAPLSGEWAGESIRELVGDLIDAEPEFEDEICDAYEEGYYAAILG